MAQPGFIDHPKFRRLVYLLKIPEAHVLGLMEFLWRPCYQDGDPHIGDELAVEASARWTGEPGVFFKAVLECRLIERVKKRHGRPIKDLFQVHDLMDHVPEYVRSRKRVEEWRKREKGRGRDDTVERQNRNVIVTQPLPNSYTSPAPAPAPAPNNPPNPPEGGKGVFQSDELKAAWERWQNHSGRMKPATVEAQLSQLLAMNESAAIAMIEHSILRGYHGLVAPTANAQVKPANVHTETKTERYARLAEVDQERQRRAEEAKGAFRGSLKDLEKQAGKEAK